MPEHMGRSTRSAITRRRIGVVFRYFCMVLTWLGVLMLLVLLWDMTRNGMKFLSLDFITSLPSSIVAESGVWSGIMGTLWVVGLTGLISIPVGVGAAVFLEEYAPAGTFMTIIEVNIANLAGVPSVLYGILGLAVFVRYLVLGRSVLAAALTLSLLILPIVIISAREAIRAVPDSVRQAAYALGASRWQTVWSHVLPAAMPGILTGVILSISRAVGETAPLIVVGAFAFMPYVPNGIMDQFTVMPVQIYGWAKRPQQEYQYLAASAIIVLLAVLLLLNSVAIWIRYKYQRSHQ